MEPKVTEPTPMVQQDIQATPKSGIVNDESPVSENQTCFGPWMLAKKLSKRKPTKTGNQGREEMTRSSRFGALDEDPDTKANPQEEDLIQGPENQVTRNFKQQSNTMKPVKHAHKGQASKPSTFQKKKPCGKHNKENIPPLPQEQPSLAPKGQQNISIKKKLSSGENSWSQSISKVQADLGEKFQEAVYDEKESPLQLLDTSEEDLKLIQSLLQKKGFKELLQLHERYEASTKDAQMLVNATNPSS